MGEKGIAKGKVRVSREELHILFGLPDDVEIIGTTILDTGNVEFLVASREEINGITHKGNMEFIRAVGLDELSDIQTKEYNKALDEASNNIVADDFMKKSFRNLS